MALFNYATKEITLKVVYYGPGLSGKTTNLQHLYSILNPETKGKLLSLSTETDRTLFFDFLPVELGKIRDFSIRFQLYTVPGQVRYNATRKVVLKGADAVVFVADSQREMREQNIESFANMRDNLIANSINPDEIPIVFQYNKRDLKSICTVGELNNDLNPHNYSFMETSAVNGVGVEEAFKLITKILLKHISRKHQIEIQHVQKKEERADKLREEIPGHRPGKEKPGIDNSGVVRNITGAPDEDKRERIALEELKETPVNPPERLNLVVDEIAKMRDTLLEIRDSFSSLQKEIRIFKDLKNEHKETNALLRDILRVFETAKGKRKKRWFGF
jgi:signal recognition particle receptor subunit beta